MSWLTWKSHKLHVQVPPYISTHILCITPRYTEHQARPAAVEQLGAAIQKYNKFLNKQAEGVSWLLIIDSHWKLKGRMPTVSHSNLIF